MKVLLLAIASIAIAGCGLIGLGGPSGGPYPGACADLGFGERQCKAMVARASDDAGLYPFAPTSIDILPPMDDGQTHLGGGMISRVRFHLADGMERTVEVWCIGVGDPDGACSSSDPTITIGGGHVDYDRPCTGETASSCASDPPTPRPESVALARPLRVPALDIPLDHTGSYRIDVGEVGLPDGTWTNSSASVADERPTTFWIEGAQLVIEPVDPARPRIHSIFREPFDGVEQARVFLEFDVTEFTPGAVLQVRDIEVH